MNCRRRFRDHGNRKEFFDELTPFANAISALPRAKPEHSEPVDKRAAAQAKRDRKAAKAREQRERDV